MRAALQSPNRPLTTPGGAAEPEREQRSEREAERGRSREPQTELHRGRLAERYDGDDRRGQRDGEEQRVLLVRAVVGPVTLRAFRSNLCHARSPRRNRHVPWMRAQVITGR